MSEGNCDAICNNWWNNLRSNDINPHSHECMFCKFWKLHTICDNPKVGIIGKVCMKVAFGGAKKGS
jgi:hypothetical protein